MYVPIDLAIIAREFGIDGDIIFGRLYYYLDKKHGYKQDDGTLVPLFSLRVGEDSHCVNFPLLASVLASLQSEQLRFRRATIISIISLILSALALIVSASSLFWTIKSPGSPIAPGDTRFGPSPFRPRIGPGTENVPALTVGSRNQRTSKRCFVRF